MVKMLNWFKNFFSNFEFDLFGMNRTHVDGFDYDDIMNQDINDGFRDKEALASDWEAIGSDFRKVIKKGK